jgi:hypothetical protein
MRKVIYAMLLGLLLPEVSHADEIATKDWVVNLNSRHQLQLCNSYAQDTVYLCLEFYRDEYKTEYSSGVGLSDESGGRTSIPVTLGYRNYLSSNGVREFLDGAITYSHPSTSTGSREDSVYTSMELAYGWEKSLSDSFTIEGVIGLGVSHSESSSLKSTSFSIPTTKIVLNYYF